MAENHFRPTSIADLLKQNEPKGSDSNSTATTSGIQQPNETSEIEKTFTDRVSQSYVHIARVAVAMAIIRTTPPGVSPELHARRMCARVRTEHFRWRENRRRLEQEVLGLRQQLLQTRLEASQTAASATRADCQRQEGQAPLTQEEMDDPLFPTPPCSMRQETPNHLTMAVLSRDATSSMSQEIPIQPKMAVLSQHATFIDTFLRLRAFGATPHGVDLNDWQSNIQDTVFKATSMLTAVVQSQAVTLPTSILLHASRALVGFAGSGAARALWPQLSEALGHLVQAILQMILTDQRLNQTQLHADLCRLVLVLSGCARMRAGVLTLLVHYVTQYGRHLRRVRDRKATLEAHAHEAMYHVLWTLERVLEQERATPSGVLEERGAARGLRERLQGALLHITDDFPLFALYVWHLVGILDGDGC